MKHLCSMKKYRRKKYKVIKQKININYWFNYHKCYYGNYMFLNVISMMEHLTIQYNANKCRLIIQELMKTNENKHKNTHKHKNKHKNKMYKNIIWK